MKVNNYHIGLDIGTSSIGWVAMGEDGKPLRVKGKTAIGARLFREGNPAADRRMFRTTRRRLNRRKWRLKLLDEIFDPYITPVDSTFFARLKQSNLSPKDSRKAFKDSTLFPDLTDKQYHLDYPTIYHLRHALMTQDKQFDIRMVYLALHHIVKYRGNFLNSTPVDSFKASKVNFDDQFKKLNELYTAINPEESFQINLANSEKIGQQFLDPSIRKFDKKKQISKIVPVTMDDKAVDKLNGKIASEIVNAILGYKSKLYVVVQCDPEDSKPWAVKFDDEDIDAKLQKILPEMDENQQSIIGIIQDLYSQVTLNQIVPNGMSLSESMIKKYNDHHDHLKLYKKLIGQISDSKKKTALKKAYDQYVGNDGKVIEQDDFYSSVKKNLDDSELSKQIMDLIDADKFMPKQRTSQNGVIPYQLHQRELDEIIEHQSKYYPWLAESNPNKHDLHLAKYKIEELVAFRIPYYVGPMITPEDQKKSGAAVFSWMKRKEPGQITPWNFDQKVDRMESANKFIKRMTTKDTYLIGEDVLPDESLLYEKFKVLNELNMVRVNGDSLKVADKQAIYQDLFENYKHISVKKMQNYIKDKTGLPNNPDISGLSDPDHFNNSLGTYNDFKKLFGDKVDDPDLQDDFEKIVEWSTVFEDKKILRAKLNEISWLSDKQKDDLESSRYQGWGRLSKKLLTGIVNDQGERIIDELWNTNKNFMQIQSDDDFAKRIHEANADQMKATDVEDVLADAYTSPQNKKAIRQVVKVVDDIQRAMGGVAPKFISIEFTRSEDRNPRRTISRERQLEDTLKDTAKTLVKSMNPDILSELDNASKSKKGLTDRLYLYFTQLGRDMYTGKPINIDEISNYDIDHILPQAFIKDDSLSNRVLVSKAVNNGKSANVPLKLFGVKMAHFWKQLAEAGLINKRKLKNLQTNPDTISKFAMHGFIRRQLVETSQVIKLVANILGDKYRNDDTKIIEITARMTHQMRDEFGFIKNREINDYHHAFDAYLTAFLGRYLYHRYIKLRPYFVYGDFKKFREGKVTMRNFNFLHDLTDNTQARIADIETGEVIWNRETSIKQLREVYHFKFMLISQEVFSLNGMMFKQKLFPAKLAENSTLIPIKQGKPVNIYGGYSNNVDAYLSIVKIKGKKENKYKVVGVPMRSLHNLRLAEGISHEAYVNELKMVLTPQFTKDKKNRKTGQIYRQVSDFEIIVGKLMYRQLVIDGQEKSLIASSVYQYNAKQLVLSDDSIKTISNAENWDEKTLSTRYDQVYDEILQKIKQFLPIFQHRHFQERLEAGQPQFSQLSVRDLYKGAKMVRSGKKSIIKSILRGIHANADVPDLDLFGIRKLGQFSSTSGINLSPNTIICYQSPTGLFERRVALKDL